MVMMVMVMMLVILEAEDEEEVNHGRCMPAQSDLMTAHGNKSLGRPPEWGESSRLKLRLSR